MRKIARFTVSVALFFETARAKRPSSTAWVANGYHVFTPHCPGGSRSFSKRTSFAPRTRDFPAASTARRRQSVLPLGSTAMEDHDPEAKEKSLFIFGVGYVATAIALTFLRKGWTVHGTCTDPRKVRSLGDQGIKVRRVALSLMLGVLERSRRAGGCAWGPCHLLHAIVRTCTAGHMMCRTTALRTWRANYTSHTLDSFASGFARRRHRCTTG